jgi:hypothetical protein
MEIKYKMTLIGEGGIKVSKYCKDERQCEVFERDMPWKYDLRGNLGKPKWYIVQKSYLENQ